MKKIIFHPAFTIGLMVRLILIFIMAPLAVTEWYLPFLDVSTSIFSMDPWSTWISSGRTPLAFPYGYAMWGAFLPLTFVAKIIGAPLLYAYGFTLLAVDFCLLITLNRLLSERPRLVLYTYWLSPITIIASYLFGLNDLIPALFLFLSIFSLRKAKLKWAGVFITTAISAKLSMVIALPFFMIYLFHNRALRQKLLQFMAGLAYGTAILGIPFLFAENGIQMLFSNPEIDKIYEVSIRITDIVSIYVVPLIYVIILYFLWRVQRLNFDLFLATTGMAFLLIVLLTPASPGWFVWSLPFLVLYQAISGRIANILVGTFSGIYALGTLLLTPIQFIQETSFKLDIQLNFSPQLEGYTASLTHTMITAVGVVLAIRIWYESIRQNDFFRLSRKPFVIGIAGDSGAGKDTFADAISGLFGNHSVTKLSGDDYHLWDRQKPMWQVMTHLNPMANDLEGFSSDLVSLSDGKTVLARHYDHSTGKMSKPYKLKSNDFIIAIGLHALYLPVLRDCYNLAIYLDIDEKLRRYFKLERDVKHRGHKVERVMASFEKREPDSARFIRPQSKYADLLLSLQPVNPNALESPDGGAGAPRLKLVVKAQNGFNELLVHRVMVGVCGLHVDMDVSDDGSNVKMTIEGEASATDIELAAQMLCPRVLEFLDLTPKWEDGLLGLMQLITLTHINQALTKRFIK